MFETHKVRRHDKFRTEWSQNENKCESKMGQDQMPGGVRFSPMIKALIQIKKNWQSGSTKTPSKSFLTQRLQADLGRLV